MKINIEMGKEDTLRTKDLYEASAIYSIHGKFIGLEKDGKQFWFVFENKNICEEIRNNYWQKQLSVDAKTYADAIRSLKDRIFNQD